MKKLLLALLLLPALANAQQFSHRYFHYDQHASTPVALGSDSTTDGFTFLGMTDGTVKGAMKFVSNEFRVGTVSNHSWAFIFNNVVAWSLLNNGNLTQNTTNGGNIVMAKANSLIQINGGIDSTASTIGWRAAAGADTACTTTCGANKGCVLGLDAGTHALVDCAAATADTCICTTT